MSARILFSALLGLCLLASMSWAQSSNTSSNSSDPSAARDLSPQATYPAGYNDQSGGASSGSNTPQAPIGKAPTSHPDFIQSTQSVTPRDPIQARQ